MHSKHPSKEELLGFALEKVTGDAWDSLNLHISSCEECKDSVARLSVEHQRFPAEADHEPNSGESSPDKVAESTPSGDPRQADTLDLDATPRLRSPGRGQAETPQKIGRYEVERLLGEGGFGQVYLARDPELERLVAVKIPKSELLSTRIEVEVYRSEARTVAQLDHPNIVPVYDTGSTDRFEAYVVSKYIEGRDLAAKLKAKSLDFVYSAQIIATVAEALQYAHEKGLVHRDIKPGNILLDQAGEPFVVDFGLALREQDLGRGTTYAGTPAYMSPEQARGEGHRVDGRSDIFSLSVVLYELLTGRRPFRGESQSELLQAITDVEPRPPRQYNRNIPKELERICLKGLAKRASDRYTTAQDLADDVRCFLASSAKSAAPSENDAGTPLLVADNDSKPESSGIAARIVPKGLRSFDQHDAGFFVQLLPGPHDRTGLPESIRFWKTRIEAGNLDQVFSVGVIYGPSGCGKSSLVKAGLLPRLTDEVLPLYVEATSDDTESRLLEGLRRYCPKVSQNVDLQTTLAEIRRGSAETANKKVLLILDQFEQWLHANGTDSDEQLVQALRQVDGERLQCILLVRDDFWVALSRFMRAIEVHLSDGRNIALIDLFDRGHARQVLVGLGRAYGRLPERSSDMTSDQKRFLDLAIKQLSENDEIVPVKLSLFVEMLREKTWAPQTLREHGGVEGLGVAFLEETFNARRGNPEYRSFRDPVRALLGALVMESADIKGEKKSLRELAQACEHSPDSQDFRRLLQILDTELHIIAPVESSEPAEHKQYQLAHDYLVPAVKQWLNQHLRKSWRGRAQIQLKECTAEWSRNRDPRFLPSPVDYLRIRLGVPRYGMAASQKELLAHAGRHYGVRTIAALTLVAVIAFAATILTSRDARARAEVVEDLRLELLNASPVEVPGTIERMKPYKRELLPLLTSMLRRQQLTPQQRISVGVALLPSAQEQAYLCERMTTADPDLKADPDLLRLMGTALSPYQEDLIEVLRKRMADGSSAPASRLRSACALAIFNPQENGIQSAGHGLVEWLLLERPDDFDGWIAILEPVHQSIIDRLTEILERESMPDDQALIELFAKRQARAAVLLSLFDHDDSVWRLLQHDLDPRIRTQIVLHAAPNAIDQSKVIDKLSDPSTDNSVKWSLALLAGQHRNPPARLVRIMEELYLGDPDPGVHSAAEWALQEWDLNERLEALQQRLIDKGPSEGRDWYVSPEGHTLAILSQNFKPYLRPIGHIAPEDRWTPVLSLPRTIAFATKEVTVQQLTRCEVASQQVEDDSGNLRLAARAVRSTDARLYCNWLSAREGIPEEEFCYKAVGELMTPVDQFQDKSGYRLPTFSEWRYACYAGTATRHFFGNTQDDVAAFGWRRDNSQNRVSEVALLRPNSLGLFDMVGNVSEWCHRGTGDPGGERHYYCGSSFRDTSERVRAGSRTTTIAGSPWLPWLGFRVVRTVQESTVSEN